ncbi:MAG: 2-C-methyl-D-erythritol 4-phosphate cytidylyltransferase [Dehalococcoidales bacterium]|nr:2-C-methyl-D-erythritol 4-phosphate cytidylyltransferase [Dehalococcoidales bacterium]
MNTKVTAIIVAAGEGQRMGGVDKIFAPINGRAALARVLDVFNGCKQIDEIVVVMAPANIEACRKLVEAEGWSKVKDVVGGGKRRQDSVAAGLKRIKDADWVVIHDGARPLVTVDLIERGLEAAKATGAAAAAIPVTDTIKEVHSGEIVVNTPSRQNLRAIQTPQVFRRDIIEKAYQNAAGDVTDDAALVENAGYQVKLYMGSYANIKITTPDDLKIAEGLMKQNER